MTTTTDYKQVKQEIAYFLRNNDLYTITERGVTTDSDTGTFASDSSHLIDRTNLKNVRSIIVAGNLLKYGTDYQLNIDFNDAGTIKCKITFTNAQTGEYTILYDYGDKDIIWTKFAQRENTISDFPLVGIMIIGSDTEDAEINGDSQIATFTPSIVIYDSDTEDIDDRISKVNNLITGNKKSFTYMRYVKPILIGSMLPFGATNNKIFQRNIDLISTLNEEFI